MNAAILHATESFFCPNGEVTSPGIAWKLDLLEYDLGVFISLFILRTICIINGEDDEE